MGQARKPTPTRHCANCNVLLERKTFPTGRLEDHCMFIKRKHCSRTCGNSRKEVKKGAYHDRARKLMGKWCESCGTRKSLIAHHINQNYKDNKPENIQTLCKNCHDFWHSTQKRLGFAIAGRMPRLYDFIGKAE